MFSCLFYRNSIIISLDETIAQYIYINFYT